MEDGLAKTLEEVRTCVIDGPCAGIYMEPGLAPPPWLVDDECLYPLYTLCQELDILVSLLFGGVFHRNGVPDYDIYSPTRIEKLARTFPKLRILLSHACWPCRPFRAAFAFLHATFIN